MSLVALRTNSDMPLRLLRVQIDDVIEADHVFTLLMGYEVEPRRTFVETNVLRAVNIDV